jgi:hypothetical protein
MNPWPSIVITKAVKPCPICNQTLVEAPRPHSTVSEQVAHYTQKGGHEYEAPTPEEIEALEAGTVKELILDHS